MSADPLGHQLYSHQLMMLKGVGIKSSSNSFLSIVTLSPLPLDSILASINGPDHAAAVIAPSVPTAWWHWCCSLCFDSRSNQKCASSINSHCGCDGRWIQRNESCNMRLKRPRASRGAAQWKCTLEGCLTDLWRLIFIRPKSRAGKTWTCIGTGDSWLYGWSIKDQKRKGGEKSDRS